MELTTASGGGTACGGLGGGVWGLWDFRFGAFVAIVFDFEFRLRGCLSSHGRAHVGVGKLARVRGCLGSGFSSEVSDVMFRGRVRAAATEASSYPKSRFANLTC